MSEPSKPLIVFCDGYSLMYGAQTSLLTLYGHFQRRRRYRLHFIHFEEGPLSQAVRSLGIPSTRLKAGPLIGSYGKRLLQLRWYDYLGVARDMVAYSWAVRRVLREIGADLLHCNSDRAGLMHCTGAKWAGVPHVNHIRRECSFGRLDRVAYDKAREVIWVSNRVRTEFAKRNRIDSIKGRVIYNSRVLPDADDPATREDLLREFSFPTDAFIAVTVASLDECKDHENLIRAAEIVCRQEPRARFLLAGEDTTPDQSRRPYLTRLVQAAGLENHVLFLGRRADVGRLMRGADILVNPSREEALGGALIEAMGYGLPCVATDTGGTNEIVPDTQCGYLVPRQDSAALAARIVELFRDDAARRSFSQNAKAQFAEHFNIERCAQQTADCFDEIMAKFPRAKRDE